MSKPLQEPTSPDFISEHEAIFALGASHAAFPVFKRRYQLKTFAIAGGSVLKRQEFLAAVEKEIAAQSEQASA